MWWDILELKESRFEHLLGRIGAFGSHIQAGFYGVHLTNGFEGYLFRGLAPPFWDFPVSWVSTIETWLLLLLHQMQTQTSLRGGRKADHARSLSLTFCLFAFLLLCHFAMCWFASLFVRHLVIWFKRVAQSTTNTNNWQLMLSPAQKRMKKKTSEHVEVMLKSMVK